MASRGTITCAYCSNPIPDGAATCPTCSAPAPPKPEAAPSPASRPQPQVVVGPGVPRPVSSPQRWPGQARPAGAGFGAPPQGFAPMASPPVQVFLNPPVQPRRRSGCVGALVALVVLGGVGAAAFVFTARSPGGSSITSGAPQMIQLNQVVTGQLTTFTTRALYQINIDQPTQVMISATASWDNYLELYLGTDTSGSPLYTDDDSGGNRNAMINAMLAPGLYTILVRPFSSATGSFTLNVTGYGAGPIPVPSPYSPGTPIPQPGYPQYNPQGDPQYNPQGDPQYNPQGDPQYNPQYNPQ